MTAFPGSITLLASLSDQLTNRLRPAGLSADLNEPLARAGAARGAIVIRALGNYQQDNARPIDAPSPAPIPFGAFLGDVENHPRDDWFNKIHIVPRRLDLGNILSTITRQIDVYNAFFVNRQLTAFNSTAGAGADITNLPALPFTINAQRSLLLNLQVTPNGAPTINGAFNFTFGSEVVLLPITGNRIVIFPFEPEAPMVERLRFLTDVMESVDGSEQRVAVRRAPRQEFDLKFVLEEGPEMQRVGYLIFDWSARVFGLPMWHEPSFLTAPATAGSTTVSVDDTTLADFRVGGLAIVMRDELNFDALEVAAISPTGVTFATPLINTYATGARVYPVRTAAMTMPAKEKRYAKNAGEFELTMRVLDNDIDLSSTAAFPTYDSKVLLSDPNVIDQSLDGTYDRRIITLDSEGGVESFSSLYPFARRVSAKTFATTNRQALWNVRRLLHALRGPQVSFYLPTFGSEVTLFSQYLSGSASLTVHNVGYSRYARQRQPRRDIRVVLKSGTTYTRTITNSSEIDAQRESLTLSAPIPQNILPEDVERIEAFEKVRIVSDEIVIEHGNSLGTARIGFPVKVVIE